MPYHRLFYHVVWATKNREYLLTPDIENIVYGLLRSKATGLGATVFALGGIEDHVHMIVSIPPSIAVSKFIGQVKGVTSARFNKGGYGISLFWQAEYAVFTLDAKRLSHHVAYVQHQKEHHQQNTIVSALER